MYIDAHCHLTDPSLKDSFEKYTKEALEQNISGFVMAGYDPSDWKLQMELKQRNVGFNVFPVFGIHPWVVIQKSEAELSGYWDNLCSEISKARGVGETGFDFFRDKDRSTEKLQLKYFHMHLDLANSCNLPVVVHSVRAHTEVLRALKKYKGLKGMIHSFRSTEKVAREYLDLGFLLSFPASILSQDQRLIDLYHQFEGASVIETDAPNLSDPMTENPLLSIISAAKAISAKSGRSFEDVLQSSTQNIKKVFGLLDV